MDRWVDNTVHRINNINNNLQLANHIQGTRAGCGMANRTTRRSLVCQMERP